MAYAHLNLFSKVVERTRDQTVEEGNLLKDCLVGFFEVVFAHCGRKILDEDGLFSNVKLFADVNAFFDVVGNAPFKFDGETVLVAQLLEGLEILALLDVLRPNVADERPDPVDVVGQAHHAENLDENQAQGLTMVGGCEVTETDSQHDVDSPIVGPDVLGEPTITINALHFVPVLGCIELGHRCQEDGEDMGEAEIKEDNLHQ